MSRVIMFACFWVKRLITKFMERARLSRKAEKAFNILVI